MSVQTVPETPVKQSEPRGSMTVSFIVEVVLLAAAAPALLFSQQVPIWAVATALALLLSGWMWRRVRLGCFFTPTPMDWPLLLLFGVMLPVSIWAAPPALRELYSIPRALVMIWNFCLFWVVVTFGARRYRLDVVILVGFALAGLALAVVSLLGTQWPAVFPGVRAVLHLLPGPLQGVFAGADEGFHPNQVAGTLLFVFPLLLAVCGSYVRGGNRIDRDWRWLPWLLAPATLMTGAVLVLAQSRAALLGLGVSIVFMALVRYRWGRFALVAGAILVIVATPFVGMRALVLIGDSAPVEALGGIDTVEHFRRLVWKQALAAASDFPLTGIGLGTFRELGRILYPLEIAPSYDVAHAHNFFLQTALDFGVPGLIALIAMYLAAAVQLVRLWRWRTDGRNGAPPYGAGRIWATGLAGSLLAQTVYSQLDAVAMGAKTSFMFWYLLAMIMGLANLAAGWDADSELDQI